MQRRHVVDVQVRPGNECNLAFQAMHRAHVVGFNRELPVGGDLAQHRHISAGLDEHLSAQNRLFAGIAQRSSNSQPVTEAHLMAARTDRFAEVDDVHRRLRHGRVERQHLVARPVVEKRAKS